MIYVQNTVHKCLNNIYIPMSIALTCEGYKYWTLLDLLSGDGLEGKTDKKIDIILNCSSTFIFNWKYIDTE